MDVERTQDGRHVVLGGRRWRATDPARARVHRTKTALGERGTPWWEQTPQQRRERWEAGLPGAAELPDTEPPTA